MLESEIITHSSQEANPVTATFAIRKGTFDRGIIGEVFDGLFYTKPERFAIKPGDYVLDIGAHIGAFSVYAAKRGALVQAYEPDFQNYTFLVEQKGLNPDIGKNIQTAMLAVTGDGRDVTLIKCSDAENTGGNWTSRKDGQTGEGETVGSITLDELCALPEKIDFLKMDCEGAEYEILMQADGKTLDKIEKIAMEWHGGEEAFHELRVFLGACGFVCEFSGNKDMGQAYFWREA